ncbi:hypothetical protein DSO57_1029627 [Entomophthora muscae]|uniref:Uncharacterized protein n=1 Tax=Entomophthora muscae TaxID=34485 RepID=A0ACC2UA80_9FUNG|nr:hypothetical protein DSO57_1029627 [Entomophthora muscae]
MIAIQNQLVQRHREDRAREEEINWDFKIEAHFDPTVPEKEQIDMEVPISPFSCHPSMEEWREVHKKSKLAPTHKPKKTNSSTQQRDNKHHPHRLPCKQRKPLQTQKNRANPLKEDKGPVKKNEWTQTSLQRNMHSSKQGHLESKGASGTPIITVQRQQTHKKVLRPVGWAICYNVYWNHKRPRHNYNY